MCVSAGTQQVNDLRLRCVQLSSPCLELRNVVGAGGAAGKVAGQGVFRHERSCQTALSDSRLPTL